MRRIKLYLIPSMIFGIVMICTACSSHPVDTQVSLYTQLGQKNGIDQMTTAILKRVYADDRINFLFEDVDRPEFHRLITEQICMETGGPCIYQGLSMREAHSGQSIQFSEFDMFIEDFILGMEDVQIPFRIQNKVLAIFAPMRSDIVNQ